MSPIHQLPLKVIIRSGLYSSRANTQIRTWLQEYALPNWALSKGFRAQGATKLVLKTPGYTGGTNPREPFHMGIKLLNHKGKHIRTINPQIGKPTKTHHVYFAESKQNLKKLATEWHA